MDALERLMQMVEQEVGDVPVDKKPDPLAGLSPKEIRRRFDENGNPRDGFDIDGNPIPVAGCTNNDDGEANQRVQELHKRAERRRRKWD